MTSRPPAWGLIRLGAREHAALLARFIGDDDDDAATPDRIDYRPAADADASATWSDAARRLAAPFPFYFEKQTDEQCGMHALNAYVGWPLLSARDVATSEAWRLYRRIADEPTAVPAKMEQAALWRFVTRLYEEPSLQHDNGVAWLDVTARRCRSIGFFAHPRRGVQAANLDAQMSLETSVRFLLTLRRALVWRVNHYFAVRLIERTDYAPLRRADDAPPLYAILDSTDYHTNRCVVVTPRGLVLFFADLIRRHRLLYAKVELDADTDAAALVNDHAVPSPTLVAELFELFKRELPPVIEAPPAATTTTTTTTPSAVASSNGDDGDDTLVQRLWRDTLASLLQTNASNTSTNVNDYDDDDAVNAALQWQTRDNTLANEAALIVHVTQLIVRTTIATTTTATPHERIARYILFALDAALRDCSTAETLPQLRAKILADAFALLCVGQFLQPRDEPLVAHVLARIVSRTSSRVDMLLHQCVVALAATTPRASVTAALVRRTLPHTTTVRFDAAAAFAARVLDATATTSTATAFRVDSSSLLAFAPDRLTRRLVADLIQPPPRASGLESSQFSVYIRWALQALHVEPALSRAFYHFNVRYATKFVKHLVAASVAGKTALEAAQQWFADGGVDARWRVGALFVALLAEHFRWRHALDPRATDVHTKHHAPPAAEHVIYDYVARLSTRDDDRLSERAAADALRALRVQPSISPIRPRQSASPTWLDSEDTTQLDDDDDDDDDADDDDMSPRVGVRRSLNSNDTTPRIGARSLGSDDTTPRVDARSLGSNDTTPRHDARSLGSDDTTRRHGALARSSRDADDDDDDTFSYADTDEIDATPVNYEAVLPRRLNFDATHDASPRVTTRRRAVLNDGHTVLHDVGGSPRVGVNRAATSPSSSLESTDLGEDAASDEAKRRHEAALRERLAAQTFQLRTLCRYFLRDVYARSNDDARAEHAMARRYDALHAAWQLAERHVDDETRTLVQACDFAAGALWPSLS